jgi:hypothetical protein
MRKVYGMSRTDNCPFCGKRALSMSKQGMPVCREHINSSLELKCACGKWLDMHTSKWGAFFTCTSCGNISMRKALEMNPKPAVTEKKETEKAGFRKPIQRTAGEITVRSDELDFIL